MIHLLRSCAASAKPLLQAGRAMVLMTVFAAGTGWSQSNSVDNDQAAGAASAGPVRLRQTLPTQPPSYQRLDSPGPREARSVPNRANTEPGVGQQAEVSDFEAYVRRQVGGEKTMRLGAELVASLADGSDSSDVSPLIPPDYLLRPGDELVVSLWGSVDADLRLQIDRSGRITIPRVGPVMLSGVRYAEAPEVISRRVAQTFKNFQLSVSLGQLRGLRVYVTGFVQQPGALAASSLSTVTHAVMRAGGPSAAGSFRNIELRRGRALVGRFDLYDLLLKGDRSADQLLQPDDVVHVGPVGTQVAVIGSVNRPGIFEVKDGENLDDLLRMAGGFTAVADSNRLALERLGAVSASRLTQIDLPANRTTALRNGDLLRAFNASTLTQPTSLQNKRVKVDGEVVQPGEYLLPPDSTLADALRAAGGPTLNAYLYATELTRESVRITQQQNYERALRDFETQATSASASRRASSTEEALAINSTTAANSRLIERLRALKPSGRIVLQLGPKTTSLPDLLVEDGDRLFIASTAATVGVFGSVFSAGSYLHNEGRTIGDYLRLAGGPTRGADDGSVFVIRANGTVMSSLQEGGVFSRGNRLAGLRAERGDTIFVPEELDKTTWAQSAKDWTQILYQFGLGIAGLVSASR